MNYGGLLSSKKEIRKHEDSILKERLNKWLPFLGYYKKCRQENYNFLKNKFQDFNSIYDDIGDSNPFMFGFKHKDSEKIMLTNKHIEFGLTHVETEIHIPVNQFIDVNNYNEIII